MLKMLATVSSVTAEHRRSSSTLLSVLTALANSRIPLRSWLAVLQSERSKTRDLCWAQRWLDEPGDDASHIKRRRRDDMLQVCFRQSQIACLAQITDPHGLRDGTFDACANGVGVFERISALSSACGLQCQIACLRTKRQATRSPVRTLSPAWAGQTVSRGKRDVDDLLSKAILGVRPRTTALSRRTRDRLTVPLDLESRKIEAVFGF